MLKDGIALDLLKTKSYVQTPIRKLQKNKIMKLILFLLLFVFVHTSYSQNCVCSNNAITLTSGGGITITAGDYCVPAGNPVVLTGSIIMNGGVNICIEEGGALEVKGSLLFNLTENHITVNDEAIMIVEGAVVMNANINSINLNDCSILEVCGTTTLNNITGFPWSNEINYVGDGSSTNTADCPAYSIHRGALSGGENGLIPAVDPEINLINMGSNAFHLNGNSQSDCGPNTANSNVPPADCVAAGTWPEGLQNAVGAAACGDAVTVLQLLTTSPLPISLASFYVETNGLIVTLNWVTAAELNNDFFKIERSTDGVNWNFIARIEGAGNSEKSINYNVTDPSPYEGVNYYRLKNTDFDGQFSYSSIRSVNIKGKGNSGIEIFPNPTKSLITIIGNAQELDQVKIYNRLGQDVSGLTNQNYIDKSRLNIDLLNLSEGMYYIKTKTIAKKVYKQ